MAGVLAPLQVPKMPLADLTRRCIACRRKRLLAWLAPTQIATCCGAANLVRDCIDSMLRHLAHQAILGEALALPGHSPTHAINGKLGVLSASL